MYSRYTTSADTPVFSRETQVPAWSGVAANYLGETWRSASTGAEHRGRGVPSFADEPAQRFELSSSQAGSDFALSQSPKARDGGQVLGARPDLANFPVVDRLGRGTDQ